jgi:hypothetical protein
MQKHSEETAKLIFAKIQRPSLGNYVEILREVCGVFDSNGKSPFITYVKPFSSLQQTERLLALRNDFKGHGATADEKLAELTLNNHWMDFAGLFEAATPLGELPLHEIIKPGLNGSWFIRRLLGYTISTQSCESIFSGDTQAGHLVVSDPKSGKVLDLHPLLLLIDDGKGRTSPVFFNSKKRKAISFLDYEFGEHLEFSSPDGIESCFETLFPRPPAENLPSDGSEIITDWFSELIGTTTEHFVGRESELKQLEMFSTGGSKSVLVVTGPPGVGKTSLLAEWTKKEMCFRHFIREGDAATYEPSRIFENLGLQLAKVYSLEWHRPTSGQILDSLNEFRRLLTEAATKAKSPILILIDGLDEAERAVLGAPAGKALKTLVDWLPSPESLPYNTRWIFSTRPELTLNQTFAMKFGADKTERLPLGRLTENDVRAMLYQVCNWYEVASSPELIKAILEKSEGSPIYIRLLVEDLAAGNIKLGDIGRLPAGIGAYFKRVLATVEQLGRNLERPWLEAQFRAKVELLNQLQKQKSISAAETGRLCKIEREALESAVSASSLELLALIALAKEPVGVAMASLILDEPQERIERALRAARSVLGEQGDRFVIFHSAFRSFFLTERAEISARMRARLIGWCARYSEHRYGYALRHYIAHLCDELVQKGATGQTGILAKIEETLTDFKFIELKSKAGLTIELLRDYREALALWPGYQRYDPFAVPDFPQSETWMAECVGSVLNGIPDEYPDRGAGPVLKSIKVLRDEQGTRFHGYVVGQDAPVASVGQTLPDQYFAEPSPTTATIAAMLGQESSPTGCNSPRLVEEFSEFVSSHRHLLADRFTDVLALAFNHSAEGAVATKAEPICCTIHMRINKATLVSRKPCRERIFVLSAVF